MQKEYVPLSAMYGRQLCSLLDSATTDKKIIVSLMTEAFINGMAAQEQLDNGSRSGGSMPPPALPPAG